MAEFVEECDDLVMLHQGHAVGTVTWVGEIADEGRLRQSKPGDARSIIELRRVTVFILTGK